MPDPIIIIEGKSILELEDGVTPLGDEYIELVQNGRNVKLPLSVVRSNQGDIIVANFLFNVETLEIPPGAGNLGYNNIIPANVTKIFISDQTQSPVIDITARLQQLRTDDALRIQLTATSENFMSYRITSTPTDNGAWWTIPVEFVESNGPVFVHQAPITGVIIFNKGGTGQGAGFEFWTAKNYDADDVYVLYPDSGSEDIQIYHLVNPTRPFVSTNFPAELAAGDWEIISPPGKPASFNTEYFIGDGVTTVWTIPHVDPIQIGAVFVGGQRLREGDHYLKDDIAKTVTISPAIITGVGIDVEFIGGVTAIQTVGQWNETTWGVARVATQAETNAGTVNDRGVTPLTLTTWFNLVKTVAATLADLILGTSTTTHITPAGLKSYVDPMRNPVSVSAGTCTLNCNNKVKVCFEDVATNSANFTIAFALDSNAEEITYSTFLTGTRVITMPSNVVMEKLDGNWNNSTKALTVIALTAEPIELSWKKINGNKYLLRVGGPYYAS